MLSPPFPMTILAHARQQVNRYSCIPSLWQNTYDRQLKIKKRLLWLVASEVTVHGCTALLFWACCGTMHHGGTWKTSCSPHDHHEEQRGRTGKTSKTYHQLPIIVLLSPTTSLGPHHLSEAPWPEDWAINTWKNLQSSTSTGPLPFPKQNHFSPNMLFPHPRKFQ